MSKICGYTCEHNKSGVCQITGCSKKSNISDKTETQTFTRYIDPVITELQEENKQLKDNWNIIKQEMLKIRQSTFSKYNSNEWDNCLSFNDDIKPILDKMQELEQGSN